MKVKELIEKLQQLDPELSVVLLPENDGIINPTVHVEGVWAGFDWWQGFAVLNTDRKIRADFSDVFARHAEKKAQK